MNFKNKIPKEEYININYIDDKINDLLSNVNLNKEPKQELYERALILNFLDKNSKVLEIGGGLGYVSNTIRNHLNNKNNHVVIEPHNKKANDLKNKDFNVFNGIISNKELWFDNDYVTVYTESENTKKISNITNINKLQKQFNIIFDTLVVDCEGALPKIMEDNPELYKQIKMIIIEYDWYFKECTEWRKLLINKYNFKSHFQLPLHWKPSKGKGALLDNNKLVGHEVLIKK